MEALTEVESEVVNVDDIEEGEKISCLIGRLVTDKSVDPSDLIQAMKKAWKPKHGMISRGWGESKLILFCFDDVIDRDWVLKNQPWHFKGSLFAIKKFLGGNEQRLSSIDNTSFWARLYDVPLSCMNERSLGLFTKQIGVLVCIDVSGEDLFGKFIRFKVSLNITKPLLRGIIAEVKGKHLWLPLKYESLPIFCLSCGIIGHDYSKCDSYDRNLKYSSLRLGEEQKGTLPHDVIENILVRLPVKYLIRYKSVCKLWKTTISNPSFTEAHLQHYKNSYSRSLIAWEGINCYKGLFVVEVQKDHFECVSGIPYSRQQHSCVDHDYYLFCNYDGLYLKCFKTRDDERNVYVLWNPSCRAYREIWCPLSIDDSDALETIYGIYYNPLVKDYEIVIADKKHYAVFRYFAVDKTNGAR